MLPEILASTCSNSQSRHPKNLLYFLVSTPLEKTPTKIVRENYIPVSKKTKPQKMRHCKLPLQPLQPQPPTDYNANIPATPLNDFPNAATTPDVLVTCLMCC
jgi:hypothetical protein